MLACGQLSLASPAYMAVGAYTAAMLTVNAAHLLRCSSWRVSLLAGALPLLLDYHCCGCAASIWQLAPSASSRSCRILQHLVAGRWRRWHLDSGDDHHSGHLRCLAILCFIFWRLEGSAVGRSFKAIRKMRKRRVAWHQHRCPQAGCLCRERPLGGTGRRALCAALFLHRAEELRFRHWAERSGVRDRGGQPDIFLAAPRARC